MEDDPSIKLNVPLDINISMGASQAKQDAAESTDEPDRRTVQKVFSDKQIKELSEYVYRKLQVIVYNAQGKLK